MPTPFYHLKIVQDLLKSQLINAPVKKLLNENISDFLFGNTAPDLQSLSGQARIETHFFAVPLPDGWTAEKEIFIKFPQLLTESDSIAKKIFFAGYLCHLQADQYWIREIYWPYFAIESNSGSLRERRLLHDRLRTYLDRLALADIPSNYGEYFEKAISSHHLPFVADKDLDNWHQYLSAQLQPNAKILTAKVFSNRHGMLEKEFESPLEDINWVENRLFLHIPHQLLVKYHQRVLDENITLLNNFLIEN